MPRSRPAGRAARRHSRRSSSSVVCRISRSSWSTVLPTASRRVRNSSSRMRCSPCDNSACSAASCRRLLGRFEFLGGAGLAARRERRRAPGRVQLADDPVNRSTAAATRSTPATSDGIERWAAELCSTRSAPPAAATAWSKARPAFVEFGVQGPQRTRRRIHRANRLADRRPGTAGPAGPPPAAVSSLSRSLIRERISAKRRRPRGQLLVQRRQSRATRRRARAVVPMYSACGLRCAPS